MPYHIAICDDDESQLDSLRSLVSDWSRSLGHSCEILCYPSAEAFLFAYEEEKRWDILLLDKENISSFEDRLSDDFFRIHRSYLVSLKYIICISRSLVTLEGGIELPLARGKYDALNIAFIQRN